MADHTKIEWTDATWNPITGCSVVSPGCTNCYAMRLAGTRLKHHPSRAGLTRDMKAGPVWTGEVRLNEQWLDQPLRWTRPRMIFVCAHGDLFAEGVPDEWIDRVFAVMALCPQHTFQVLSKRPERMRTYLSDPAAKIRIYDVVCDFAVNGPADVVLIAPGINPSIAPAGIRVHLGAWPLPNVWLGVSAEDQRRADERIPILLDTPAAIRWVSAEPLLGPIDFLRIPGGGAFRQATSMIGAMTNTGWHNIGLHWIVAGGESGPGARPMHPDWMRSIRDQCAAAGVPFLFKQWGSWKPASGCDSYSHGPTGKDRAYPSSAGICWLRDGRILYRDFSVKEHASRILAGEAYNTRAVEVDEGAIADFTTSIRDESRTVDNPLGLQWMYQVDKKAAGRLLDGVEHNSYPEVRR